MRSEEVTRIASGCHRTSYCTTELDCLLPAEMVRPWNSCVTLCLYLFTCPIGLSKLATAFQRLEGSLLPPWHRISALTVANKPRRFISFLLEGEPLPSIKCVFTKSFYNCQSFSVFFLTSCSMDSNQSQLLLVFVNCMAESASYPCPTQPKMELEIWQWRSQPWRWLVEFWAEIRIVSWMSWERNRRL